MMFYVVYLAETGRISLTYDVFLHVKKLQLEHYGLLMDLLLVVFWFS